jgi:hypothetical protein
MVSRTKPDLERICEGMGYDETKRRYDKDVEDTKGDVAPLGAAKFGTFTRGELEHVNRWLRAKEREAAEAARSEEMKIARTASRAAWIGATAGLLGGVAALITAIYTVLSNSG